MSVSEDQNNNRNTIGQEAKKYLMAIFRHLNEMTKPDLDKVLVEIQAFWQKHSHVDKPFDPNKIWQSMITNNNQHWMNYKKDDDNLKLLHYAKLLAQYYFEKILLENIHPNNNDDMSSPQNILKDFFARHQLSHPTEEGTRECFEDLELVLNLEPVYVTIRDEMTRSR